MSRIIDFSDPTAPVEVGAIDTPDYVLDVSVVANIAYLASTGAGLRLIDVSDPSSPVEV